MALARRVRCPVLVISGKKDKVTCHADARALAQAAGGKLVAIEGGDHLPEGRQPVTVKLAIREFVQEKSVWIETTGAETPNPFVIR